MNLELKAQQSIKISANALVEIKAQQIKLN
jgi:hypothetical protein